MPAIIPYETHEVSNIFCFAALADKQNGTFYTDATGTLPTVSLDGNQYYFIAYHYDTNYIFAMPIKDVKDATLVAACAEVVNTLKEKGYKPTLNITDNQAVRPLKEYLKSEDCAWQFVKSANHCVNATERAIQTFKNHFISGLCSTDGNWPLQLWDTLTLQAVIAMNLLRASRIDPNKSAYHQLHGHKYDWNAHPMAPPGTKAIVYLSLDDRGSWAPRGIDAWCCGPDLDHYRNMRFYVPATKAYRTSGSFDLFPQHCMLPELTPDAHATEVYDELVESIQRIRKQPKKKLLSNMTKALRYLARDKAPIERVADVPHSKGTKTNSEGAPVERMDNPPPITTSTNPTNPQILQTKPRTHQRSTRTNDPGRLPPINDPNACPFTKPGRSCRLQNVEPVPIIPVNEHAPSSTRIPYTSPNIISQEALNHIMACTDHETNEIWLPNAFTLASPTAPINQGNTGNIDIEHFCAPVAHPMTGETISKHRKLMRDAVLGEMWATAFGKEFGNLAQGDDRTGEKGTNAIFVMTPDEILRIPKDRVVTYGRIVVDYRPQKKDPNRVHITTGGNLIQYPGELTTRTADLTTSKILWNSVLNTPGAKFMGIDIKSFYLLAPLERYEYMKMPLSIFPQHVCEQYNLEQHAKEGFVFLEIRGAIYCLPQAGALANKLLRKRLAPAGYYEVAHTPGLWKMCLDQSNSPW